MKPTSAAHLFFLCIETEEESTSGCEAEIGIDYDYGSLFSALCMHLRHSHFVACHAAAPGHYQHDYYVHPALSPLTL